MALFPTFGLGTVFYVVVLFLNAAAVLSEDRFLARIPSVTDQGFGGNSDQGIVTKLLRLLESARTLFRIPLIGANILIMLYELTLG